MGSITQDDLLDALREAMRPQPNTMGAFTGCELAERLGCTAEKACKLIRRMLEAGEAVTVKFQKPDITGRIQTHVGYKLKEP